MNERIVSGRVTRRLTVRGRVQGVRFRDWTIGQARALGLAGWVRNRRDGSVEILACGEGQAVEQLAERCRQGPPAARVGDLVVTDADEAVPAGFEWRPTC